MLFDNNITALLAHIAPEQACLVDHRIYESLQTVDDLKIFMERHVFAVWDFMCLLKSLQRHLTCVEESWRPVGAASTRRLVNELVLAEESDVIDGVATGHFELYLGAMRQIGADTGPIDRLIAAIEGGAALERALDLAGAPPEAAEFVRSTFDFIRSGKPHVAAAAFTFGREDALPAIFARLSEALPDHPDMGLLADYLTRHVQLDGEDHGPKATQMVCELCGGDPLTWAETGAAALAALQARTRFWSAIALELDASRHRRAGRRVEQLQAEAA